MPYSEGAIRKMLPKTYLRKHVAHEIFVTITHFKNLVPMMDKYVYNDGSTKLLMSLSGTIPVTFTDKSYNIPICVWVEDSYPQTAPICYVTPTREMMLVPGKYVSSSGEVVLPYLEEWNGDCDLVRLLQVMLGVFGEFPPVCKRPFPDPEQAPCWLQFYRQEEALLNTDGNLYFSLFGEDGQYSWQENESNC
ncbi:tumor susceptibility gene 101 protein [Betta splendens]|uniref:Tumor susceptibility gene 101 protein n=1 Tax=Betta splendens TaxID=158456 RepID=A0A6P7MTS1_BETSP|nr:tumor susceptibility gene 101 protein [Betta splendens]